ncbi:MAG: hypothetical protein HDS80_00635 [Bacteroidales bacterium]|nr:hypothetical protein [Bacteroidales bacterium]
MISKLISIVRGVLRWVYRAFYLKPRSVCDVLIHRKKWCNHTSYYPELKSKSSWQIEKDQILQSIKYGFPNPFYFSYGFDVKSDEEMNKYLHNIVFMKIRNKYNVTQNSAIPVLRDKVLFGMLADYMGVNYSKNLGITTPEGIFDIEQKQETSYHSFFNRFTEADLFIKPVDGECGKGIMHLLINKSGMKSNGEDIKMDELEEILKRSRFLIQSTVEQHPDMASLHPQSLNTIRLVTIRNRRTGELEVFPSILRIGTGGSNVDNTSQGGLAVGIKLETGQLKEYGFYKPEFGTRVSIHPDSGIVFSEFKIPFFEECKKQAILLHSMLPSIHSIGWDVAVGKDGPVFIEGNDNWEINGPQICNGGLKKAFLDACGDFK